jgi:hypothetical protein
MSYAQYGTIQASDYNTLVGVSPGATANTLNAVWSVGASTAGYGQTAEGNVTAGDTVTAIKWANLINKTANSALHQSSSITSVTAPASGNTIVYNANVVTNLQTTYTNRLNAGTQGSTSANAFAYGSTWSTALTFTHTVTFANGDAARYFFNSGGQLKVTCSHANSTAGINLLFNNLASNVGTVAMSAPTSGAITISSVSYNGITKVGGGGSAPTISTNSGYYAMTISNANVFTQTASTGPAGYLSTFIRVIAKSNGTQGSNGDAGSIVTLYTVWDEVPNGLVVGTGSTVTVTAQAPETTYLANTWGTISVAGSATGS